MERAVRAMYNCPIGRTTLLATLIKDHLPGRPLIARHLPRIAQRAFQIRAPPFIYSRSRYVGNAKKPAGEAVPIISESHTASASAKLVAVKEEGGIEVWSPPLDDVQNPTTMVKRVPLGDCSVWKVTAIDMGQLSVRCQHPGWSDTDEEQIFYEWNSTPSPGLTVRCQLPGWSDRHIDTIPWKNAELDLVTKCPLHLAGADICGVVGDRVLLCWIDDEHSSESFQREVLRVCQNFGLMYRIYGSESDAVKARVIGISAIVLPDAIVCNSVEELPGTLRHTSILVASDSGIEKPAVPGRTDEFLMRIITKHRRAHVKVTVGDADCWLQARGLEYAGQEEQTLGFDLGTKHLTGMRTDWGVLSIFSLLVIQLAHGDEVLLDQTGSEGHPILDKVLSNNAIRKVGVRISEDDAEKLRKEWNLEIANAVELGEVLTGLTATASTFGLAFLVEYILGIKTSSGDSKYASYDDMKWNVGEMNAGYVAISALDCWAASEAFDKLPAESIAATGLLSFRKKTLLDWMNDFANILTVYGGRLDLDRVWVYLYGSASPRPRDGISLHSMRSLLAKLLEGDPGGNRFELLRCTVGDGDIFGQVQVCFRAESAVTLQLQKPTIDKIQKQWLDTVANHLAFHRDGITCTLVGLTFPGVKGSVKRLLESDPENRFEIFWETASSCGVRLGKPVCLGKPVSPVEADSADLLDNAAEFLASRDSEGAVELGLVGNHMPGFKSGKGAGLAKLFEGDPLKRFHCFRRNSAVYVSLVAVPARTGVGARAKGPCKSMEGALSQVEAKPTTVPPSAGKVPGVATPDKPPRDSFDSFELLHHLQASEARISNGQEKLISQSEERATAILKQLVADLKRELLRRPSAAGEPVDAGQQEVAGRVDSVGQHTSRKAPLIELEGWKEGIEIRLSALEEQMRLQRGDLVMLLRENAASGQGGPTESGRKQCKAGSPLDREG